MAKFMFAVKYKTDFMSGSFTGEITSANAETAEEYLSEYIPKELDIDPAELTELTILEV